MFVTCRKRRGRSNNVYSCSGFLESRLFVYPHVRLSDTQISGIIKTKYTNFGPAYYTQIKLILNVKCHSHRPQINNVIF